MVVVGDYQFNEVEKGVMAFWNEKQIYAKVKERNKEKQPFYFLEGPPYTSGKVHLGTAWNKSMKDAVLRYKRMAGFDVWDRAGYDMHGIPTEHATEKKLGISGKEAIEQFGVANFIAECKKLCVENMLVMNEDFKQLGVWMDFDNPYQSITDEFIDGEWWLIKRAHENGRLYEGERAMTWCADCGSAVAKHELEYKDLNDDSIYVKFKLEGTENEYLLVWTTTPWTIPINICVCVHPDFDYVKCKVGDEVWIVAKELADKVLGEKAEKEFEIVGEVKGKELGGREYRPPFYEEFPELLERKKNGEEKIFTVLVNKDFVNLDGGTGLVHVSSGAGDTDYELSIRNGVKPFNVIDDKGEFPKDSKLFSGLAAKKDDKRFIELMEDAGAIVAQEKYKHSYAHCWRCKHAIVYKTTKQWFFKVEDMKDEMIKENDQINWVPEAGYNAFNSWLQNLRDNSITKQRYWGTPLPVWRCEDCGSYDVFGSKVELTEKSAVVPKDMHKPLIDEVEYACGADGCNGTKKRIPDILDVWVDAGCASWNCLDFPQRTDLFERYFPATFIIEGKDQIRGWFNLLHVASMVAHGKPSFKTCYMHGFVNAADGRKMSKSLGNYILPSEVVDEHGADAFRYYVVGGTNAGIDLNYNPEDVVSTVKLLKVFWNLHKFVLDLGVTYGINPAELSLDKVSSAFSQKEKYMLSKLYSGIEEVTKTYESFEVHKIPGLVGDLFLTLSRTYIQMVREKLVMGSQSEKEAVAYVIYTSFVETLKMFSTLCPFVGDKMFLHLKEAYGLSEESVHLCLWPKVEAGLIDTQLEEEIDISLNVNQAIFSAREKANLGVRWPVAEVTVVSTDKTTCKAVKQVQESIMVQTNVKSVKVVDKLEGVKMNVRADHGKLGPDFGARSPKVVGLLKEVSSDELLGAFNEHGFYSLDVDGESLKIVPEHVVVTREVPEGLFEASFKTGEVYLDGIRTPELIAEGYAREVTRRVQALRKKAGLLKKDRVKVCLVVDDELAGMLETHSGHLKEKVGADELVVSGSEPGEKYQMSSEEKVKQKEFSVHVSKL